MILGNCIVLSIRFEGETKNYKHTVEYVGTYFSSFFLFEFALKFIAMGFSYFKHSWNQFDFAIVIITCFDLSWNYSVLNNIKSYQNIASRLIRSCRIFRIMRLINKL